jgi:hypothetical protein
LSTSEIRVSVADRRGSLRELNAVIAERSAIFLAPKTLNLHFDNGLGGPMASIKGVLRPARGKKDMDFFACRWTAGAELLQSKTAW